MTPMPTRQPQALVPIFPVHFRRPLFGVKQKRLSLSVDEKHRAGDGGLFHRLGAMADQQIEGAMEAKVPQDGRDLDDIKDESRDVEELEEEGEVEVKVGEAAEGGERERLLLVGQCSLLGLPEARYL